MLVVSRLTQLRSLALCLPSYSKQLLEGVKQLTGLRVSAAQPAGSKARGGGGSPGASRQVGQ